MPIKKVLVVEDSSYLQRLFAEAIQKNFPESEIRLVDTLENARDELRQANEETAPYTHMIIDCGFPTEFLEERLRGNRNGLLLISEIRKGDFGEAHKAAPIAFNSAEFPYEKFAEQFGPNKEDAGNTRVFFKGDTVPAAQAEHYSDAQKGIVAKGIFRRDDRPTKIYTEDTVCKATMDWFKQLYLPKEIGQTRQPLEWSLKAIWKDIMGRSR
jgi:hypothetical protein